MNHGPERASADLPTAAAVADPSRRALLLGSAIALGGSSWLAGCATPPAADAVSAATHAGGLLPPADIALLNRVTWGIDSATLADWSRLSRRDCLREQLHPPTVAALPAPVQAQLDALELGQRSMQAWVVEMEQRRRASDSVQGDDARKAAKQAYQKDMNGLARDAATRTLLNALYSPNQLQEQLAWFWFNHFNVHQHKGNLRALVGDYEEQLRSRSLGRFSDLLIASATHVAMIRYLDNEQNAANRINENFAREVMELHTLGVDAGYAQKDVQELARVLTGLGVNFTDRSPNLKPAQQALYVRHGATEFNPARHDIGAKTVLGVEVSGGGWNEIIEQLTRLARHPATARHVSRKLAVYMAADDPAPALVDRMSRAFVASEGDIAVTLQAMFDAPEFAPTLTRKFKDPMHYVVSAVRLACDGRPVLNVAPMLGWLNRMGEGLYSRQTPDGYPLEQVAWSGSGQMGTRFEIARAIGSGSAGLFRTEGSKPTDVAALPQLSNALYRTALAPTLGERTRTALDGATSTQEWNAFLLSSPEFMVR